MKNLYHATPVTNLRSIGIGGLLTSKSRGKLKAVWLHTKGRTPWAILHVARRHKCDPRDVVVLAVNVKRAVRVRRGSGLWFTTENVNRDSIRGIIRYAEVVDGPS